MFSSSDHAYISWLLVLFTRRSRARPHSPQPIILISSIHGHIHLRDSLHLLDGSPHLEPETTEVDSATVLKAIILVGHTLFVGIKEGSVPSPSPSLKFCPGFGLLHMAFSSGHISMSPVSHLRWTQVLLNEGPSLFKYDLIFTSYNSRDPISK